MDTVVGVLIIAMCLVIIGSLFGRINNWIGLAIFILIMTFLFAPEKLLYSWNVVFGN